MRRAPLSVAVLVAVVATCSCSGPATNRGDPGPGGRVRSAAVSALPEVARWRMRDGAGDSFGLSLRLGRPVEDAAGSHPDVPGLPLSACAVVPGDGVVPGVLVLTDFDLRQGVGPAVAVALQRFPGEGGRYEGPGRVPGRNDRRVIIGQGFTDTSITCSASSSDTEHGPPRSTINAVWEQTPAAGAVLVVPFFVVVGEYRSPSAPSGDRDLLEWIQLRPVSYGGYGGTPFTATDAAGQDGVSPHGATLTGNTVDLP